MGNMVYNYIGLMYRAHKIKIGFNEFKYSNMVNKVFLVIYARDASEKLKKDIIYYCSLTNTIYREYGTKNKLGKSVGKDEVAVISVMDKGAAVKLIELIGGEIIGENKSL